jgi:hypothetical protein
VTEVLLPTLTTWNPVPEGGVQSQGPELGDELVRDNGVERCAAVNQQHSHIVISPLVQVGVGSVKCN